MCTDSAHNFTPLIIVERLYGGDTYRSFLGFCTKCGTVMPIVSTETEASGDSE